MLGRFFLFFKFLITDTGSYPRPVDSDSPCLEAWNFSTSKLVCVRNSNTMSGLEIIDGGVRSRGILFKSMHTKDLLRIVCILSIWKENVGMDLLTPLPAWSTTSSSIPPKRNLMKLFTNSKLFCGGRKDGIENYKQTFCTHACIWNAPDVSI